MQRASQQLVARMAQNASRQIRTYVPGKVIRPEHVLNRARLTYKRPNMLACWRNQFVLFVSHVWTWYWGAFLLVFWLRGGFNGEIPPPLE